VIDHLGYADADIEAKAARRGLWADVEPVPHWAFRHKLNVETYR
jgi:endonuclease YncB( thermonuclease family)